MLLEDFGDQRLFARRSEDGQFLLADQPVGPVGFFVVVFPGGRGIDRFGIDFGRGKHRLDQTLEHPRLAAVFR